jgi:hypothetical protein
VFWVLVFTLAIAIAAVPLTLQRPLQRPNGQPPPAAVESKPAGTEAGSALGHIEPEDGVIHVSARAAQRNGAKNNQSARLRGFT